jgi:predicted nucleic acid-binding protein
MKILLDTNVVLDVLLDRQPHAESSSAVWAVVESGACEGLLAAHALTTIYYLIRRQASVTKTGQMITAILRVFSIAAVDDAVIRDALQLSLPDFEDAITASSARLAACELIVTRDPKGFRGAPVRPVTPEAAASFFRENIS